MREHDQRQTVLDRDADARRRDGITFRELAAEYLGWVQEVKDAKPSTVSGYQYLLMERGTAHRRGDGRAEGFIMAALGDKPATSITTRDIEDVLRRVAAPRETCLGRSGQVQDGGDACRAADGQSAPAADVREVPLPDQAAAALDRLSQRTEFTGSGEYVFANCLGRRLDPTALRRRFERAREAADLAPLRFHDLRHTCGSLLVAGGVDLQSVKAAMGHSRITTTERYLHARPATEQAARFTRAFAGALEGANALADAG